MHEQRTEVDVAWAAGLFEGEGSFSVQDNGRKVQISARLAMTDFDVVRRFHDVVQMGSTFERRSKRPNDKPLLTWQITEAAKVRVLIALFLPYLGERRRARALELLDKGRNIAPHKRLRTHCTKGHPYSGDNLILEKYTYQGEQKLSRRCRTCRTIETRERMRKKLGIAPGNYRT